MSGHSRSRGEVEGARTSLEVADIFGRHLESFGRRHTLSREQQKAARDIVACRTDVLGGHLQVCTACGWQRPAYNSCRNRHCPKCQSLRQARWVEQRLTRILPVHYFHVVFTLPSELAGLVRSNRAELYELLVKSAAASLLALGRDPRWLGKAAQLGVTAVLHTWARDLHLHPHVHCIVTGGGLGDDDHWVAASPDFLFPVHVLGALFRGKFLAGLERLRAAGKLRDDQTDRAARRRRARLYQQSWVVYAKRPFGGPEQVYRYLGRYTHRVAISNTRLVSMDDQTVAFRTRGQQTATLDPVEFIRRFLEHVLPKGFVKIRHFGLLAPANVNGRLERAKELLGDSGGHPGAGPPQDDDGPVGSTSAAASTPPSYVELLRALTGIDLERCPACHGRTVVRVPLPTGCRGPPEASVAR
jgi:hypothetical protein